MVVRAWEWRRENWKRGEGEEKKKKREKRDKKVSSEWRKGGGRDIGMSDTI